MIKRTPQEIADIFQCYVAMNQDGAWYMFEEKPERQERTWRINSKHFAYLHSKLIDIPFPCDWTHLYEPRPYSEKSADSENKPDHLGEVYTHKEYVLLGEFQPGLLMQKVNELLQDGFRLYGNPWTGPDSNYGYIHYQAMVRGV